MKGRKLSGTKHSKVEISDSSYQAIRVKNVKTEGKYAERAIHTTTTVPA